jgi:Flp pilus assembly protein TadG
MTDLREASRGQGLVEFALVLPVLVLILFALLDAGRGVLAYAELANASRVGARVAIINQSNDASCGSPEQTFKCAAGEITTLTGVAPGDIPDVAIDGTDCVFPSNCTATVRVDHTFRLITPVISAILSDIAMSASTTMPLERTYVSPSP